MADDDGSKPRRVGPGSSPHMAPDGSAVAYLREGRGNAQELVLAPRAGGKPRLLMRAFREPFNVAFSADSQQILAQRGPEIGKRKLVLIDVASGAQTVVASGFFNGYSFSPAGDEFVYGMASSERYPPRTDIFRYSIVSGRVARLTKDRSSESPLWGPRGDRARIYFVKQLGASKRKYGPKNEIYTMNPTGRGVRRLTHTKVDPLLQGLVPIAIDDEEKHLLAQFVGQDTSYAVKVNARTGAQKPLLKAAENGFVGTALSVDGAAVLGFTGSYFEGSGRLNVATVPWAGGRSKVLVKNAYDPDWSR